MMTTVGTNRNAQSNFQSLMTRLLGKAPCFRTKTTEDTKHPPETLSLDTFDLNALWGKKEKETGKSVADLPSSLSALGKPFHPKA